MARQPTRDEYWSRTLARGFTYVVGLDKIMCSSCNLILDYRQEGFDASRLHRQLSPLCRSLDEWEVENVARGPFIGAASEGVIEADDSQTIANRFGDGVCLQANNAREIFEANVQNAERTTVKCSLNSRRVRHQSESGSNRQSQFQTNVVRSRPGSTENCLDLRASVDENLDENEANIPQSMFSASSTGRNGSGFPRVAEPVPCPAYAQWLQLASDVQLQPAAYNENPQWSFSTAIGVSVTEETLSRNTVRALHPSYASFEARMESFPELPVEEDNLQYRTLAEAGFFHTGNSVRCFYCDGGFSGGWCGEDDPWTVHAQEFPRCRYVLMMARNVNIVEEIEGDEGYRTTGSELSQRSEANTNLKEFLQSENEKMVDEARCKFPGCNNPRDALFMYCGHLYYCRSCSLSVLNGIRQCPACSDPVEYVVDVYSC